MKRAVFSQVVALPSVELLKVWHRDPTRYNLVAVEAGYGGLRLRQVAVKRLSPFLTGLGFQFYSSNKDFRPRLC